MLDLNTIVSIVLLLEGCGFPKEVVESNKKLLFDHDEIGMRDVLYSLMNQNEYNTKIANLCSLALVEDTSQFETLMLILLTKFFLG